MVLHSRREFQEWFADSQVVAGNGQPLVLYHGTNADFKSFRPSLSRGEYGAGSYFTSSKELANKYASSKEGAYVMPVYVRIENPVPEKVLQKILSKYEHGGDDWNPQDISDDIEDLGYDGILLRQGDDITAVAFDARQVKSALGNSGVFDPMSPDIRFSHGEGEVQASTPERVRAAVAQLVRLSAEDLAGGLGAIVVTTVAELKDAGVDGSGQAWHDQASNTVVLVADRIEAGKEQAVFLHEIAHRHGRAALPNGRFEGLVQQLKGWARRAEGTIERTVHDAAAARVATAGVAGPLADEELFAYAVEEAVARGVTPSAAAVEGSAQAWLHAVEQSLLHVLDKLLGNDQVALDAQDLVDLAYGLAQLDRPESTQLFEMSQSLAGATPHGALQAPEQGKFTSPASTSEFAP